MKNVITLTLLAVVCCCYAAPSLRNTVMENEKVLDASGNIILRWTVLNATEEIEMELEVNCTGWVGILFNEGLVGQPGAYGDGFLGGYDDELGLGYVEDRWVDLSVPEPVDGGELDAHADVELLFAEYREPWTIFRILRKLDTGDQQDVSIKTGPMLVTWTYATFDNTSIPHRPEDTGFDLVAFIPRD